MKKRFSIVGFSLSVAVLFTILFQSIHSFDHLVEEFAAAKCHHHYGATDTEITHQHHNFDHCLVCDFSFSSFIATDTFSLANYFAYPQIPYFFTAPEVFASYSGTSVSLRGPPSFIA